ncbi:MAG: RagB/SusD family nutrient uptake outer membrane protein [Prevotellaceae bacterium]|jgi:hypothetical protein|nr:RagB/SusD family nutrient uptake outer membrane protein [Prevotellaceae bacterium]
MKKILITLAIALSLAGCNADLLDTFPYDKVSSDNVWTRESTAEQVVIGIYQALRFNYIAGKIDVLERIGVTGDYVWGGGYVNNTANAYNGMFYDYWVQHYEMISRANNAIANLPTSPITGAKLNRLVCESKFLRAYAYYRLNMVFAGVPLYLEPKTYDEFTQGRETPEAVWQAVVNDLTDCINSPDLPGRYEAGNASYGRATKGAAYALRGKVYLWMKRWADAESDFKKVGELGYSLFQGNFGDLFTEANERCPEMIFSLQAIRTVGLGQPISRYYGAHIAHGWCISDDAPNTDFVNTYEWADGRPFNWDDVFTGYNSMTPAAREVYFLRDDLTTAEKTTAGARGADTTKYLGVGNEARCLLAFTDRDPRLNATIITPYATFDGAVDGKPATYVMRWPFRNYGAPVYDIESNTRTSWYYLYRKFVGVGSDPYINRDNSPVDIPLIRYADVLLGLAEAHAEQNEVSEGLAEINKVRRRAGVAELQNTDNTLPTYVADADALKDRIRKEFRWEFCGEAVSYFEDLRTGTYKDAKFFAGAGLKCIHGIYGVSANVRFTWADRLLKWPLPPGELEKNPNLAPNNPGWQ